MIFKLTKIFNVILLIIVLGLNYTYGQGVTSAAINGTIVDQNGNPLPGATVVAIHVPSGSIYGSNARADGRYNITGLRVGGPYTLTVSMVGFTTQKNEGIYLSLEQNLKVNFICPEQTIELKGVTVTAEKNAILSAGRTGAATSVSNQAIENLPTIRRRIEDMARLTPQYGGIFIWRR